MHNAHMYYLLLPDLAVRTAFIYNLRELGINKIRLLTNHPKPRTGFIGYGLEIVENIKL